MASKTEGSEECWSCQAELPSGANYCSQCAVPVTEFGVSAGRGFLSDESEQYLSAIVTDSVSYPTDSRLDDELENSLQSQLREDIRKALVQLGTVCAVDEELLVKSFDVGDLHAGMDSKDIEDADIPESFAGFVSVADALVNVLGPEMLESLAEQQQD